MKLHRKTQQSIFTRISHETHVTSNGKATLCLMVYFLIFIFNTSNSLFQEKVKTVNVCVCVSMLMHSNSFIISFLCQPLGSCLEIDP